MKIEYFHASHYGNGAMVAEEFKNRWKPGESRSTFVTSVI